MQLLKEVAMRVRKKENDTGILGQDTDQAPPAVAIAPADQETQLQVEGRNACHTIYVVM